MTDSTSDQFAAHVERIRQSELLQRSDQLRRLFDFLVERSLAGKPPKEIEIAIDVFDKDASFEIVQSAIVRVTVHKLRRKLDEYYALNPDPAGRLTMPRGVYRLVFEPLAVGADIAMDSPATLPAPPLPLKPSRTFQLKTSWLVAAIAILVMGNVVAWRWHASADSAATRELQAVRTNPVWSGMLDDNLPIVLVVGDYYMFAELNEESMEVQRLVREFNINSQTDLERFLKDNPQLAGRYMDVSLQYLPISTARALQNVAPLLEPNNKGPQQVHVMLASDLTPSVLKSSHVVYVGLLSGLGIMSDFAFRGSRLAIGDSYDELVDKRTQIRYVSQAGMATKARSTYRDFAYFSVVDSPNGNRIIILAGTRDVAVMQIAEALTHSKSLQQLIKQAGTDSNFEALYAVEAIDRTNLDGRLVFTNKLDVAAFSEGLVAASTTSVASSAGSSQSQSVQ